MPRRSWKIPFAASGDVKSIPTAIQPDGSVSVQQGYGFDYERPTDGTDPLGKVYPRAPHNGLLNEITASIGEIQQNGFPIWASDMAPYPGNAWVRHAGKVWQNTIDSNNASPTDSNSGWTSPGAGGRVRITSSSTFVVPAGVTTVYVSGTGGGGGGGGGAGFASQRGAGGGGGGGAGRSAISQPVSVTGGQSISVTIGVGGTRGASGGPGGNGGSGGSGGATSLGSLLTLAGGTGGELGTFVSGAGGSGGSPGGGWGTDGIVGGKAGDGGQGGSGPFGTAGGGARGRQGSAGGVETTVGFGFGTGGGGGGGGYMSAGAGVQGGVGMPGYLEIEW